MKNKVLLTVIWNLVKLLPWDSWVELSLNYLDKKASKTETEIDDFVLQKLRDFYYRLRKADVI
jgi:hypothetical protein